MMVGGLYAACCHMTLAFAIMHLYKKINMLCVCPFFYIFLKSDVDRIVDNASMS